MADKSTLKESFKALYIETGKLVREVREEHGDSLDEAANKLGIDVLLLSAVESGESAIDIDIMDRMHRIYGVDVQDFNVKLNARLSGKDSARVVLGTIGSFDRLRQKVNDDGLSEKYGTGVGFMLRDIRLAMHGSMQTVMRHARVSELYVYKLEAGELSLKYIDDSIYKAYGITKDDVVKRLDFSTRALFIVADSEPKLEITELWR